MQTTMDQAGRLVVPREVRRAAGFTAGMKLDIRYVDGKVEIEPALAAVRIEDRDGFLVAVHDSVVPPLPADIVEQVRQEIYLERERQILGE